MDDLWDLKEQDSAGYVSRHFQNVLQAQLEKKKYFVVKKELSNPLLVPLYYLRVFSHIGEPY